MKTEPKIGDTVYIYIYSKLWECTVTGVEELYERCFELTPKQETKLLPNDRHSFLMQARYFFPTAREAINAEIKYVNDDIRKNKKELDFRRSVIKDLKKKRADFQRMLEKYPKPS